MWRWAINVLHRWEHFYSMRMVFGGSMYASFVEIPRAFGVWPTLISSAASKPVSMTSSWVVLPFSKISSSPSYSLWLILDYILKNLAPSQLTASFVTRLYPRTRTLQCLATIISGTVLQKRKVLFWISQCCCNNLKGCVTYFGPLYAYIPLWNFIFFCLSLDSLQSSF